MFEAASLGLFLVTCAIAVITPEPDTLLVLGSTFSQGRKAGFSTALGVCSGYFVHITAAVFGLTAIVLASAVSRIRALLTTRPKIVAWFNRMTGGLLIALGIRLVLVERRAS